MNYLYLLINFCAFIMPFLFSFHPKLAFYKRWPFLWPAIFASALPFLVWDSYFTSIGVWGFNSNYLTGIKIINLPLEEVLFFICIPYACLFTYHCFGVLIEKDFFSRYATAITLTLIVFLIVAGVIFFDRLYTNYTFIGLAAVLVLLRFWHRPKWLSRFYFTYLILLIPFCIVNGVLTGTGLESPIVWYNDDENLRFRLLTIPFEDVFYGMFLILLNTIIYEYLSERNKEKGSPHLPV